MTRVTVTGATGMLGSRLVRALRERGDEVTVLSRSAERARAAFGDDVEAHAWDLTAGAAPVEALAGRDAVVHLAGEQVGQRWTDASKRRILESRELGTRHLVEGLRAAEPRPAVLVSSSAVGYYGPHGDEELPEDTPPGDDFLARVCIAWEREARAAEALGMRVVIVRTGVVLDKDGGALGKMLPFFKAGVGGPVAGGRQMMPWVHADDVAGIYLRAIDDAGWSGPVNAAAPRPVTNKAFSKALGRALHRPAIAPVPAFGLQLLYGDMSEIVTKGQNAVPRRTLELGYSHEHPDLDEALRSALRSD
ncbi:MAG TPA: TIGR01777 family oxidoreductase [Solirubrobacteraceae bacterium]|nr:TIGR01777 family oxidoreductase [Solirubrobacteraceae bacterium]